MSLMIGYELVCYRLTHLSWFNPFQTRVKPVITKNVYLPILKSIPDFTSQKNLIIFYSIRLCISGSRTMG